MKLFFIGVRTFQSLVGPMVLNDTTKDTSYNFGKFAGKRGDKESKSDIPETQNTSFGGNILLLVRLNLKVVLIFQIF